MSKWNQIWVCAVLICALLSSLTGCTGQPQDIPTPTGAPTATAAPTPVPPSPTPSPLPGEVYAPAADGGRRERGEKGEIDYSHTEDGYIMVRGEETGSRMKFWLNTPAGEYTYDVTPDKWEIFPLSGGSGSYAGVLFEQTENGKYVPAVTLDFEAELESPLAPFLRPNQQVDYLDAPLTLERARALTEDCESPLEAAEKVFAFLIETIRYDEEQAGSVESGYLSDPDGVLERGRGICLDYAAVMASMLRSVGVPCRLAVGDAGRLYHAWNEVWDGESWVRMDPTFAASGKDTAGVEYRVRYYY